MMNEQTIAHGAALANQILTQQLTALSALFKQAEAVIQSKSPPPQMSPDVQASIQIAQAETARKAQMDQGMLALRKSESEVTQQLKTSAQAFTQQLETFQVTTEKQNAAIAEHNKLIMNAQDNLQHQQTELQKNHEDNQTAIRIAIERVASDAQKNFDKSFEVWKAKLDAAVADHNNAVTAKASTANAEIAADAAASKTIGKDLS